MLAYENAEVFVSADPLLVQQWYSWYLRAPDVWLSYDNAGGGVNVVVFEPGSLINHVDLPVFDENNLLLDESYVDNDETGRPAGNVMGIIAAIAQNWEGIIGLSPDVSLYNMRSADLSFMLGFEDDHHTVYSNSWGPEDDLAALGAMSDEEFDVLKQVVEGGSIVVVANGNGGEAPLEDYSNQDAYANSIYTIAVAVVDRFGQKEPFQKWVPI